MFDYIDILERVGSAEILDDVLEGLPRDDDGNVVYSMDTRPAMKDNKKKSGSDNGLVP